MTKNATKDELQKHAAKLVTNIPKELLVNLDLKNDNDMTVDDESDTHVITNSA